MQGTGYIDKIDELLLFEKKINKEKKLPLIFLCHPKIIFHYTKSGRGEKQLFKTRS